MQRVRKAALFTSLNLEKMVQPCVGFPASLSDELGLVPVSRGFSCYLEARRYRLRLPAAYVPVCAPLRLLGRTHSTPQAAVWPNALFQLPSFSDAGVGCFLLGLGLLLACSLKGWEFETARDRFRPESDMKQGLPWKPCSKETATRGLRAGKESAEGVVRLWSSSGDIGRRENLQSLFARVAARQEPKDSALGEADFSIRFQPKNVFEWRRLLRM